MPLPAFRFAELAPDPRLAPWLSRYWEFSVHGGESSDYHVPPDGGTSLLAATGPGRSPMLLVSGPWLVPLTVPVGTGDCFWGVRLRPGAAREFLGIDPTGLLNVARPLHQLFGKPTLPIASALSTCATLGAAAAAMNEAFLPHVPTLELPDELATDVVAAVILSRGNGRMHAIAEAVGVSPRTLRRRFRTATGIGPKQFAKVIRFRFSALGLLESDARLSAVAARGGYADQPHLTREWAELLGISPRRLLQLIKSTSHDNIIV